MELDDLKQVVNRENQMMKGTDIFSFNAIKSDVSRFEKQTKKNDAIETLVAIISFVMVMYMMFLPDQAYHSLIKNFLPELIQDSEVKVHILMYISLVMMAIYSVSIPIKLYLAKKNDDSLSWTLTSRVDNEISKLEAQKKLWSTAHLWSFMPAAVIGVLFFWGLHISITDTWIPNIYLIMYFIFVGLASLGGIWLKNNNIGKKVVPLLERLYDIRKEILS